ncbi:SMI1/KNR4 family protein [Streptomyces sp. NPDC041003]|uniref:SMI1/KNR4 family protein n=1 Tax=Streptomyces sp. NPDC041003 TaxID=3155730 RepID=UPI0033F6FD5A
MNPSVPPVRSSWDRIDGWLREHAPASYENLAPPAAPGAVEEAQAEMGLRFPAGLTDSLLCHDGLIGWDNVLPGPPPQSAAQIVRHWRMCVEIDGDEDPSDPGEPGEEPWWHPLWIPWAQSDGNAQVIDMREGPHRGRLGTACHDDTAHFDDGWPSLAAYLAEVADVLDHGGLVDGCAPYLTCDGELWWDLEGETDLNGEPLTPAPAPGRAAALAARASWSLAELLGAPVRPADEDAPVIEAVARDWSVVLPPDYVAVASAYGDVMISGYLYFFGARGLRAYGERQAPTAPSPSVPYPVLPTSGGVLAFGHTIEGDRLFLVPHRDGSWTVSAFRRGWADWHDTGLGFGEWFRGALAGVLATDWLPEWEPGPHPLELDES